MPERLTAAGRIRIVLLMLVALLLVGCAPRSYVVLVPSPDGTVGEVVVSGAGGVQRLTEAGQTANTDGSMRSRPAEQKQIERDFSAAIAASPILPVRFLLYFTSGRVLSDASISLLSAILEEANGRTTADISIIGHTDTIATTEYNDRLALVRAQHVAEVLEKRGLKANSITIESHGKRNLLVPTPDNTFEPLNRRVEVSIR